MRLKGLKGLKGLKELKGLKGWPEISSCLGFVQYVHRYELDAPRAEGVELKRFFLLLVKVCVPATSNHFKHFNRVRFFLVELSHISGLQHAEANVNHIQVFLTVKLRRFAQRLCFPVAQSRRD